MGIFAFILWLFEEIADELLNDLDIDTVSDETVLGLPRDSVGPDK